MDGKCGSTTEVLCRIAGAGTLQEIMDLSFEILENPIFVTDWEHNLLAHTQDVETDDPFWNRLCQEQRIPDFFGGFSTDDCMRQNSTRERSLKSHSAVPIVGEEGETDGLLKVVEQNGVHLGVLVVNRMFRPIEPEDEHILELISVFAGAKLLQISPEREHRAVNQFLLRLLNGENLSKWQTQALTNPMKWLRGKFFCVIAVTYRREVLQRQSNQEIARLLSVSPYRKAVVHGVEVVCLLSVNAPVLDWNADPTGTKAFLEQMGLIAGASGWFTDISAVREKYLTATKAMEIGAVVEYGRTIYAFDEIAIYLQYRIIEEQGRLTDFIHHDIQRLQAYDDRKKGELVATLYAYLETNQNFVAAAQRLHVHPNTVRYRIGQCTELLQNDLSDGRLCFRYLNSLKIIEYLRKSAVVQYNARIQ